MVQKSVQIHSIWNLVSVLETTIHKKQRQGTADFFFLLSTYKSTYQRKVIICFNFVFKKSLLSGKCAESSFFLEYFFGEAYICPGKIIYYSETSVLENLSESGYFLLCHYIPRPTPLVENVVNFLILLEKNITKHIVTTKYCSTSRIAFMLFHL